MFPCHDQMKPWFHEMISNPFVTPVFFLYPTIFLQGQARHLCTVSPFKLVILLFGFHSPVNIFVKNNIFGNFLLKPKFFTSCRSLFNSHRVSKHRSIFSAYLTNCLSFVDKATALYHADSFFWAKFPLEQKFELFAFPAQKIHQNNSSYSRYISYEGQRGRIFYKAGESDEPVNIFWR